MGILGVFVPKEYGGSGLSHVDRAIVMEELARYSPGLAMTVNSQHLGISAIMDAGTEEQKQKYLPLLCSGEFVTGLATTEAHSGSDVGGQKTLAIQEEDSWVINGTKCLITNSHVADMIILTAKTGEDERERAKFTAFIIEKDTPGFKLGRKENKVGLRSSCTGELILDNVKVPTANILGEIGKGTPIAMKGIGEIGRAGITAICVGILRTALEMGVEYAKQRIVYGKPIAKLQAIQIHIAHSRLDYEAARLLLHKAAFLKDEGKEGVVSDFSLAKLLATEGASKAAKRTIEIMGGYGIISEYGADKALRDALSAISGGGTNEVQRIVIAADTLK